MPAGTVASLHRWPGKSLAGEDATALLLDPRGVAGDRAHALVEFQRGLPRLLTVRQVPGMLRWTATYPTAPNDTLDPDDVPLAHVTSPDGTGFDWDDPRLPEALSEDLGREIGLRRDIGLMQDLGDSVLVTTQASLDAAATAMGRDLDLRRFRTNVHVVLDAEPFAEEWWEGRRLRVGEAELELLHPCVRCLIPTRDPDTTDSDVDILRWLIRERTGLFGINAQMLGRGRIAVGDPVELV